MLEKMKEKIDNGERVESLPPSVCDISNDLCKHFWCCCCSGGNGGNERLYRKLINDCK